MEEDKRRRLMAWVAGKVMPHEGDVRAWLARSNMRQEDVDDVIQEAYCRLAALASFDQIDRPGAYFFSIARNLMIGQMRRGRIVDIAALAEIEALAPYDDRPSPEREVAGRIELARVKELVASLPERCRRVVEMRKIEGLPQRDIAGRMGIPESIVENEGVKGIKLILAALRRQEADGIITLEGGDQKGRAP